MPRTKPLALLIGLRLRDPGSEAARRAAEAFLEEAASLEPSVRLPLAWNLPLAPFAGEGLAELAVEIKTRVRSRSDSVLLMGYRRRPPPPAGRRGAGQGAGLVPPQSLGDRGQEPARPGAPAPAAAGRRPGAGDPGRGVRASRLRVGGPGRAAGEGRRPIRAAPGSGRAAYRFPARRRAGRAVLYPAWVSARTVEPGRQAGRKPRPFWPRRASPAASRCSCCWSLTARPDADPAGPDPCLLPLLRALEGRFQPQFLTLEEALAAERRRPGRSCPRRPPCRGSPAAALPLRSGGRLQGRGPARQGPAPD